MRVGQIFFRLDKPKILKNAFMPIPIALSVYNCGLRFSHLSAVKGKCY